MFIRFDRIHERDGQTDTVRQTDTAWRHRPRPRFCVASGGKTWPEMGQLQWIVEWTVSLCSTSSLQTLCSSLYVIFGSGSGWLYFRGHMDSHVEAKLGAPCKSAVRKLTKHYFEDNNPDRPTRDWFEPADHIQSFLNVVATFDMWMSANFVRIRWFLSELFQKDCFSPSTESLQ